MGAIFPISHGWFGYPSIAAMSINPGIDVMCQEVGASSAQVRRAGVFFQRTLPTRACFALAISMGYNNVSVLRACESS
jgi:hypothetical protein